MVVNLSFHSVIGFYCDKKRLKLLEDWKIHNKFHVGFLRPFVKDVPKDMPVKDPYEAGKIIANLIVLGSGVLLRAFSQVYYQALANASKSGVAQETVQNLTKSSKAMIEQEARIILGINEHASAEEMLHRYENLFERNAKTGSFYLQSKVQRAKECLEASQQTKANANT
ncbi:hypothetical protein L7F22_029061 [Adiantum nelumboides]|nr:hypothetical protein [Adiantum nelumboides]